MVTVVIVQAITANNTWKEGLITNEFILNIHKCVACK